MPHTLVIVDDDSLLGWTLGANLEDAGFHPEIFNSGRAALNYFASGGKAAAVLLDWKMREMDGPEFLGELRAQGCNTPVLILTGYLKPGLAEQAIALGATALLDKSKSFGSILEQIQRILSRTESSTGPSAPPAGERITGVRST
jgi:DNA-binding NtrC family response regulator